MNNFIKVNKWLNETHVEIQLLVTVQLSLEMADHLHACVERSIFISSFPISSFLRFRFSFLRSYF